MVLPAISAAVLALALQVPQPAGAVRGQVRSESTGALIPGASVEVLDSWPQRASASDSAGRYHLAAVPAGRRTIRARRVGYAALEMEVVIPPGREVELDIALRMMPIVLAPVRVDALRRAAGADTLAAPEAELRLAGARAIQGSPGLAELGLTDAVQGHPGQEPPDPGDVLFIRGTSADLKLVYLDGAPVYAPFPLGGLLEPFTPDLLASADLYLGGAPARYDGGLSYILDLRTRGARSGRFHSSGAMDLLGARMMAEVPLGSRAGLLVSGRGVHDAGTGWVSGEALPYGYREGLARGDVDFGALGALSVTAFANGERVWLDSTGVSSRAIQWGNTSASARYAAALRETSLEITAATGDFQARLPMGSGVPRVAEGSSRRTRVAADLVSRLEGVTLRYGAAFEEQWQEYRTRSDAAEADWAPVGRAGEAMEAGVYLDAGMQLGARVHLRGGLRADHFSLQDEVLLAPRLSATWMITDRAALTLAGGRYHQYLRPPETSLFNGEDRPPLLPVAPLALARSSHVSLGLDQDLGDGVRLGLEGFYKEFEGLPGGESSDASASGMDLWVRRGTGRWQGWLGYSLAWTWSLADATSESRFAGRHLLSSGVSAPLGERGRLDFGLVYGAGLPYSAVPFTADLPEPLMTPVPAYEPVRQGESVNAGTAPLLPSPSRPYLRVDLAASRTWAPRWGGSLVEFTPYVRLLNTLGQRDALFYRAPADGGDFRPVVVLPIVPVVGMEWRF
jgi:hypothetical protein